MRYGFRKGLLHAIAREMIPLANPTSERLGDPKVQKTTVGGIIIASCYGAIVYCGGGKCHSMHPCSPSSPALLEDRYDRDSTSCYAGRSRTRRANVPSRTRRPPALVVLTILIVLITLILTLSNAAAYLEPVLRTILGSLACRA